MLRGYGLSEKELDAAGKRFNILKNKLVDDVKYYKGKKFDPNKPFDMSRCAAPSAIISARRFPAPGIFLHFRLYLFNEIHYNVYITFFITKCGVLMLHFSYKRFFILLLTSVLLLSLFSCGKEEAPEQTASETPSPSEATLPPPESEAEASFPLPDLPGETETETEPETEPPDPRLDVLNHYQNLFIATEVNNYLNVRDAPSTGGAIIGKLVKNSGGEILEDLGNGWYHILSGGIDGFIAAEYCVTGDTARAIAPDLAHEMVRVTAERLNVRTGPGLDYDVWTQLGSSELQTVEEEAGDWYKIMINNTYGYISRDFAEKGWYLTEAMPWSSLSSASPRRQQLFAYAEQFIGTPYVYGGTSLSGGIDCSSYVQQVFKNSLGIGLDRTSGQMSVRGTQVSLQDAQPGDLMFYTDQWGTIDHVAIYMGDGKILHASRTFGQVGVSAYNYSSEPLMIRNVIGE